MKKREIRRVFVPNRGEIACRLVQACLKRGLSPIVGYSIADASSRAVRMAPESICIGPADARDSYLNIDRVLDGAAKSGADAVHPGYGFLAENSEFARATGSKGLVFIGPTHQAMQQLGDKVRAKELAKKLKVPTLDDHSIDEKSVASGRYGAELEKYLKDVDFPLLVKAAAGGGGRGMRIVEKRSDLESQIEAASREARNLFGDGSIFIEPYISGARHVEVQIAGDLYGDVRALGTRDCSIQRKHQKVIEEAPASWLAATMERKLCSDAESLCLDAQYQSLGTVEFLVTENGKYYFLEVNTRLQVEHPVTEESLGIDLVDLQLRTAAGEKLSTIIGENPPGRRFSLEARICAEAPEREFQASTGSITALELPEGTGVRVDWGFEAGDRVTHYYDSLIAKVITSGDTRNEALDRLEESLASINIAPIRTNIGFLQALVESDPFKRNSHTLLDAGKVLTDYVISCPARFAIAAVASVLCHQQLVADDDLCSAWNRIGNWTASGYGESRVPVTISGVIHTVVYSRSTDAVSVSVSSSEGKVLTGTIEGFELGDGLYTFTLERTQYSGTVQLFATNQLALSAYGEPFSADFRPAPVQRRPPLQSGQGTYEVRSHLPGKIVSIPVKSGEAATAGAPLLVLESMKMEHILVAPVSGVISEVIVAAGQSVAAGDLLMVIGSGKAGS